MRMGLLLLCLLVLAAPAAAQEFYVVKPLPPKNCDLSNARPANTLKVAAHPENAPKGCLKLSGILVGRFFYADLDSYTRAGGGLPGFDDVDAGRSGTLGLYASDEVMANLPDRPVPATIAGVVGSCEKLRGSDSMALGYCHYTDGGYLAVGEMSLGEPFTPTRMTSDADRRRVGDLEILPTYDPLAKTAQLKVQAWLQIIKSGDLRRLAEFESRIPVEEDPAAYKTTENPYAGSEWRWLREAALSTPVKTFRQVGEDADDDYLIACICRLDGCDGLWPITTHDAHLNPDRPYACVEVSRMNAQADWAVFAGFDGRRLREPTQR